MDDNEELRSIFVADQRIEMVVILPVIRWPRVARVSVRRARVGELFDAGLIVTAADHFHAAMVFQHGGSFGSFRRAHVLAKRARDLGHPTGAWLAAASFDRWLTTQGRPQHFGTQFQSIEGGVWQLVPVDPATTDAERAAWGVPSLAESRQRAAAMTASLPSGPPTVLHVAAPVVVVAVTPGQLRAGLPVEVDVAWSDQPVTVPLAGLAAHPLDAAVAVRVDGAGVDGADLLVRVLVADEEDLDLTL